MAIKIETCNTTDVDRYIAARHYLGTTPAGARLRFWICDDNGDVIGAMMWGRPTSRAYDQQKILELTRFCLAEDATEHCAASKALALARKYIRKHCPDVKGLISYASTGQQHEGTIYMADNWFAVGTTSGGSWSKPGRKNIDTSKKIRFVRSV